MTILAPAIGQAKASPQALAWNIGTIGRTTSSGPIAKAAALVAVIAWSTLERCE